MSQAENLAPGFSTGFRCASEEGAGDAGESLELGMGWEGCRVCSHVSASAKNQHLELNVQRQLLCPAFPRGVQNVEGTPGAFYTWLHYFSFCFKI